MPVDVWRAPRSSVAGLDPGAVGDRPVPHLLAALLTPTHVPHARLPKHWEGQIISSALVKHPLLARFSRPLLFPLSFRFFFFLFCFFCSFAFSPLSLFSSRFSPQNVPLARFYISGPSPPVSPPQAHPAPLVHGYHDGCILYPSQCITFKIPLDVGTGLI